MKENTSTICLTEFPLPSDYIEFLKAVDKQIEEDQNFKRVRERIQVALDKNPKKITLQQAKDQVDSFNNYEQTKPKRHNHNP